MGWPPELRAARRDEVDGAAERAVAAARAAGAEALLVPGDLWDAESVPASSIHRLLDALASFAPKPVFIAPGNHDFAGAGGFYDASVLSALGMRSWPPNVFVFRGPNWTALPVPGREDVSVVGRAYPSPAIVVDRPLLTPPARPAVPHAILMLHGSLETYAGPDGPTGAKRTAPFSRRELLNAGFSWAALGHHHQLHIVTDDNGMPCGAYAGCPTGRGLDETGTRHFLKVTLREGEKTLVESPSADTRTIRDLMLDASDLDARALLGAAESLFHREGVRTEDIVRFTLTGQQPYGSRPAAAFEPLHSRAKHLVLRDRTQPPAAGETAALTTAEGRFASDLLARREAAPDAHGRRVLELALALGRDALAGRPLHPPEPEDS
jgi:DNA repair exonuclease SbcCD nuclease subunit